MSDPIRIPLDEARRHIEAGQALLVCAYDDATKCSEYHLDGSITLAELEGQVGSLPKSQEIIFYCA